MKCSAARVPVSALIVGFLSLRQMKYAYSIRDDLRDYQQPETKVIPSLTTTKVAKAAITASDAANTNDESSSSSSSSSPSDLAWGKFYENAYNDSIDAHEVLLQLYGCPLFSVRLGVDAIEKSTNSIVDSSSSSSSSPPSSRSYSRIPNEETWSFFEEAYYHHDLDLPKPPPIQHHNNHKTTTTTPNIPTTGEIEIEIESTSFFNAHRGMLVPFEVRYDSTFGRTIHATDFIPKHTVIWTEHSVASFQEDNYKDDGINSYPTFNSYRRFLEYLHNHESRDNNDWACDAIMWHFFAEDYICLAFDHGSLFNDSGRSSKAETVEDVDCTSVDIGTVLGEQRYAGSTPCTKCEVARAKRDIYPGEEFRYDYGLYGDDDSFYDVNDNNEL